MSTFLLTYMIQCYCCGWHIQYIYIREELQRYVSVHAYIHIIYMQKNRDRDRTPFFPIQHLFLKYRFYGNRQSYNLFIKVIQKMSTFLIRHMIEYCLLWATYMYNKLSDFFKHSWKYSICILPKWLYRTFTTETNQCWLCFETFASV